MKTSEKFERQIKRIHELIEQSGSSVMWNDRLLDPDNPKQYRQIDISIRRDNKLTIIECRIHKEKQDVKWVEELIGRRLSLRADAVIAVSASGFTEGAILKAKNHGVVLRDFVSLSIEEVQLWGHSTSISLTFYEYSNACISFPLPAAVIKNRPQDEIRNYFKPNTGRIYNLFTSISEKLDTKRLKEQSVIVKTKIFPDKPMLICNCSVHEILFESKVKVIKQVLLTPSVVAYSAPGIESVKRNVFVETVESGKFEITKTSDDICVVVDLFAIEPPANCHFRYFTLDLKRAYNTMQLEILSPPKLMIPLNNVTFRIFPLIE